jgi:hypothetical protein
VTKHDPVRKAQKLWKKGGASAILVASRKSVRSASIKVLELDKTVRWNDHRSFRPVPLMAAVVIASC